MRQPMSAQKACSRAIMYRVPEDVSSGNGCSSSRRTSIAGACKCLLSEMKTTAWAMECPAASEPLVALHYYCCCYYYYYYDYYCYYYYY